MKLPVYRRQEAPLVDANMPRLSVGGAGALGRTIAGVGEQAGQIADQLAAVELRLAESRQVVELAKTTADLDTFTAERIAQVDSSVSAALTAEQYESEATKFIQERVRNIPDERQRNLATAHLIGRVTAGAGQVWLRANARIIEDTQADALEQIRRLSSTGREQDLKDAEGLTAGLVAGGVFSAEAGRTLTERARKETLNNAFFRELRANPGNAFDLVNLRQDIFAGLSDEEHASYMGMAQNEIDRRTKANEKAYKEQYELAISDLTSDARNKTLTSPGLELARKNLRMKAEDYTKLWNVLNETKESPSTLAVLHQLEIGARSARPGVTKEQLAAAYRAGDLNTADYDRIDNTLTANLRHLDTLTERGETRISADHAQAEQMLRTALQTTSSLEILNQEGQQAYSLALDELTRRSKRFGGQEDPIAVYRDILPKYQANLAETVSGRISVMRSTARHPGVKELERAYQGKPQDQAFFDTLRTLRAIDDLEKAISRMPAKPKAQDFGREPKK